MSTTALFYGELHRSLAEAIARAMKIAAKPIAASAYPDGERTVRIDGEGLRGARALLLHSLGTPVDDNLMTLLLAADAAHAAGAASVVAIVPYLAYARQDHRRANGEPRSASLVAKFFAAAGVAEVLTVDVHTPALESAFPMPFRNLSASEVFLPALKAKPATGLVVVAPDAGGLKRAQYLGKSLATPVTLLLKERAGADKIARHQVLGDVKGKTCLLVDDMASTGGTLLSAAEALRAAGAAKLVAAVTHAVMAPGAAERLAAAGFDRFLVTDSLPMPPGGAFENVSLAPLLARALS